MGLPMLCNKAVIMNYNRIPNYNRTEHISIVQTLPNILNSWQFAISMPYHNTMPFGGWILYLLLN